MNMKLHILSQSLRAHRAKLAQHKLFLYFMTYFWAIEQYTYRQGCMGQNKSFQLMPQAVVRSRCVTNKPLPFPSISQYGGQK